MDGKGTAEVCDLGRRSWDLLAPAFFSAVSVALPISPPLNKPPLVGLACQFLTWKNTVITSTSWDGPAAIPKSSFIQQAERLLPAASSERSRATRRRGEGRPGVNLTV